MNRYKKFALSQVMLVLAMAFMDKTIAYPDRAGGIVDSRVRKASQEASINPPPEKPFDKVERTAQAIRADAKKKAEEASSSASCQSMKDRIRLLNERIDLLEGSQA